MRRTAGTGTPRVVATVAEGLDTPWSIAFLPGGPVLVTERGTGRILALSPSGAVREAGRITVRAGAGEGGLLGLEPAPSFARDGTVFAYATAEQSNRVMALRWDGSALGGERVLVDGIPAAAVHNGGRLKVGPDGMLYIGAGDAGQRQLAQDRASLAGKILRVAPDGSPAPGNPFGNRTFTYGHRNVQGLAWDSRGRMWASEFGPDRDDELNLITAGSQYGWPGVTGAAVQGGSVPAAHVWPSTADASPSALAILDDVAYVACLRGQRLWRVPLPGAGFAPDGGGSLPGATEHFRGEYGRLRDVVVVPAEFRGTGAPGAWPDADLWLATNEGDGSRILAVAL
ncbi:PQQ-dependent sugar dehydrogenase [Sinomonas halotolerans]